ncbi:S-methyl-5'-thioadenosine phosphorylase-like [Lethenteron reissneri]|uniref:S-methyl-5'-thioadenosine phosphorylase-like n=1 Tax=Lethenteron reissneri TaxID=7753 RepID=UPI002AB7BF0E|nr:S-methyl-5'-thioadenosine phosphorylase-like [Lethenteron reissneri]
MSGGGFARVFETAMAAVKIGIIGGTGLDDPDILEDRQEIHVDTPYGKPSDAIISGRMGPVPCLLLGRHGRGHSLPPSRVNYRANLWALRAAGATHLLATTACGSLREDIRPGDLVFLDQFIDRTTKREQTFYDGAGGGPPGVCHIPIAEPFCPRLRQALAVCARELGVRAHVAGTVVTIEGPRFSSRAESRLFGAWGAHVVNMTSVPECVLARELALPYAAVAMVTDYDCWRDSDEPVSVEKVMATFRQNAAKVTSLLVNVVPYIAAQDWSRTLQELKDSAEASVMLPNH